MWDFSSGKPSNAHTLSIGFSALKAHLDHGEHKGDCKDKDKKEKKDNKEKQKSENKKKEDEKNNKNKKHD